MTAANDFRCEPGTTSSIDRSHSVTLSQKKRGVNNGASVPTTNGYRRCQKVNQREGMCGGNRRGGGRRRVEQTTEEGRDLRVRGVKIGATPSVAPRSA